MKTTTKQVKTNDKTIAKLMLSMKSEGVLHTGEHTLSATKETRAGLARRMIVAGASNAKVLSALAKAFPQNDWEKHSYYPSWYRAQLVSLGVISSVWAHAHA
jgi:hypothetical protein